jgi:serine/threonine-protein kinase RsbT
MNDEIKVFITSDQDVVTARQEGRSLAEKLGFSKIDATLIATAISEVARNVIQYVGEGEVVITPLTPDGRSGMSIVIRDTGPGIPSIELALQDEHPSGGRAGLGLPGARRLMNEFEIESHEDIGTTITMVKWREVE